MFNSLMELLCPSEGINMANEIYVVVCNTEIVEEGELPTEPVVLDYLGYYRQPKDAEVKTNQLNAIHGEEASTEYYEKHGVEPFVYIPLAEKS